MTEPTRVIKRPREGREDTVKQVLDKDWLNIPNSTDALINWSKEEVLNKFNNEK